MLLILLACAPIPSGTWMFTRVLTPDTGEECVDPSVSHNFLAASTPEEAEVATDWNEETSAEWSPEVFFGRLEATATGALLIIGSEVYPGEEDDAGDWTFYWTNSSSGNETDTHVSGYLFAYTYETSTTIRISGAFDKDQFVGTHETESSAVESWVETDTWSDEAAATITSTGQIPASTYLVTTDDTGATVPAVNDQYAAECSDTSCTLLVNQACAYRYTLTGVLTELEGEDSRWAQEASQAAGN